MTTTDFYRQRVRQECWRHHSAKEREALADLALAIKRYLAQMGPENINNAAFMDAALPHVEKINQVLATAKPRRLSQLHRTLQLTAQTSDPKKKKPFGSFMRCLPFRRDGWSEHADNWRNRALQLGG